MGASASDDPVGPSQRLRSTGPEGEGVLGTRLDTELAGMTVTGPDHERLLVAMCPVLLAFAPIAIDKGGNLAWFTFAGVRRW
jgi:hypothetical protein